jgi:hypothetical protein
MSAVQETSRVASERARERGQTKVSITKKKQRGKSTSNAKALNQRRSRLEMLVINSITKHNNHVCIKERKEEKDEGNTRVCHTKRREPKLSGKDFSGVVNSSSCQLRIGRERK